MANKVWTGDGLWFEPDAVMVAARMAGDSPALTAIAEEIRAEVAREWQAVYNPDKKEDPLPDVWYTGTVEMSPYLGKTKHLNVPPIMDRQVNFYHPAIVPIEFGHQIVNKHGVFKRKKDKLGRLTRWPEWVPGKFVMVGYVVKHKGWVPGGNFRRYVKDKGDVQ